MSQGNFLCGYLKQTKMSFFSFTIQRTGRWNTSFPEGGGVIPMGGGRR
jgi:hypothetical protein